MLRLRFSTGLILGLVVGLPAGFLIGMLVLPPRPQEPVATSAQVIDLTRKLEAVTEQKQRADIQLEQFQKMAEQMTATFKSLEQRFTALEETQRLRESQRPPAPVATETKMPVPTAPQAVVPPAAAAPAEAAPAEAAPADSATPAA